MILRTRPSGPTERIGNANVPRHDMGRLLRLRELEEPAGLVSAVRCALIVLGGRANPASQGQVKTGHAG